MIKKTFSLFRQKHSLNYNVGLTTLNLLILLALQMQAYAQTADRDNGVDVYLDVETIFYLEPGNISENSWAYQVTDPGNDWMLADYDDSAWNIGNAGFGAGGLLPGDVVNTL